MLLHEIEKSSKVGAGPGARRNGQARAEVGYGDAGMEPMEEVDVI